MRQYLKDVIFFFNEFLISPWISFLKKCGNLDLYIFVEFDFFLEVCILL